jgi:hypothetical protein
MTMHGGVGRVPAAPPAAVVATSVNGGLRTCLITRSQTCLWTPCFRVAAMDVHPQRHTPVATFCAQRRAAVLESGMSKALLRGIARALARRPTTGILLPLANIVARDVVLPQHKCEVRPINKRIAKRTCKRIAMHVWTSGEAVIATRLKEGVTAPTTTRTHRRVPKDVASGSTEHSDMAALTVQSKHSTNALGVVPSRGASEALGRDVATWGATSGATSVGAHISTGLDKSAAKRGNSCVTTPMATPIVR